MENHHIVFKIPIYAKNPGTKEFDKIQSMVFEINGFMGDDEYIAVNHNETGWFIKKESILRLARIMEIDNE